MKEREVKVNASGRDRRESFLLRLIVVKRARVRGEMAERATGEASTPMTRSRGRVRRYGKEESIKIRREWKERERRREKKIGSGVGLTYLKGARWCSRVRVQDSRVREQEFRPSGSAWPAGGAPSLWRQGRHKYRGEVGRSQSGPSRVFHATRTESGVRVGEGAARAQSAKTKDRR